MMAKHRRIRGRHRAPSTTGRTAARVATVSAAVTGPLTIAVPAAEAGMPAEVRAAVIQCESGDRNVEHGGDPGGISTASGYYQFVNKTWQYFGGGEFAARAIGATKAQQDIVADRAYDTNGLIDWEASRSCWEGRVGRHAANGNAPKHAAPTAPKHALTYTVKSGDTLGEIAAAHHTTVQELVAANPCVTENPDLIFPGEQFNV